MNEAQTLLRNSTIDENDVREAAKAITHGIRVFAESATPFIQAIENLLEKFKPQLAQLFEGFERYKEFNEALVARHKQEGLMVPPYFANLPIDRFLKIFSDDQRPAIEIYRDYFSDPKNNEEILTVWAENKFFEDRIPIFRDAFDAHVNQKHTLSIPAFLLQVEGILCEMFAKSDHAKVRGKLQNIKFKPIDDEADNVFSTAEGISKILVDQVLLASTKEFKTDYPRRNIIAHGKNVFYHREPDASLRCILLLDFLRDEEFLKLGKPEPKENGSDLDEMN